MSVRMRSDGGAYDHEEYGPEVNEARTRYKGMTRTERAEERR